MICGWWRRPQFIKNRTEAGPDREKKNRCRQTNPLAFCRHEANLVAGLVSYLLKQGYTGKGDITVLTPYLGQLFMLKDVVGRTSMLHVQVM